MLTQLSARTGELAHLGQGVGARPRDDGSVWVVFLAEHCCVYVDETLI